MNNECFLKVALALGIIVSANMFLFGLMILPSNDDEGWFNLILEILFLVVFSISFFLLLRRYNVNYSKPFWVSISVVLLILGRSHFDEKFIIEEIRKYGGKVVTAVIYDRYTSLKSPNNIYIHINLDGETLNATYRCDKNIYNKLSVGDTILIIHSLRSIRTNLPYKYFPTSKEIHQAKQGRLFKKGRFLD